MKKSFTPIMIVHMILMALVLAFSIYNLIMVLTGSGVAFSDAEHMRVGLLVAVNIITIAALLCGIVYLRKGYSKEAAPFYKGFMLLIFAAWIIRIVLLCIANQYAQYTYFSLALSLTIVCAVVVFVLGLIKNIGERSGWILMVFLLVVDCVSLFLTMDSAYMQMYRIIDIISHIVLDINIGLAVRGKFADKTSRGTD